MEYDQYVNKSNILKNDITRIEINFKNILLNYDKHGEVNGKNIEILKECIDEIYHIRHNLYVLSISYIKNLEYDEISFYSILSKVLNDIEFLNLNSNINNKKNKNLKDSLNKTPDLFYYSKKEKIIDIYEVSVSLDIAKSYNTKYFKYVDIINSINNMLQNMNIDIKIYYKPIIFKSYESNLIKQLSDNFEEVKLIDLLNIDILNEININLELCKNVIQDFYNICRSNYKQIYEIIEATLKDKYGDEFKSIIKIKLNKEIITKKILENENNYIIDDDDFNLNPDENFDKVFNFIKENMNDYKSGFNQPKQDIVKRKIRMTDQNLKENYKELIVNTDNKVDLKKFKPSFHFIYMDYDDVCMDDLQSFDFAHNIISNTNSKNNKHIFFLKTIFNYINDEKDKFFQKKYERFRNSNISEPRMIKYKKLPKEIKNWLCDEGIFGKKRHLNNRRLRHDQLMELDKNLNSSYHQYLLTKLNKINQVDSILSEFESKPLKEKYIHIKKINPNLYKRAEELIYETEYKTIYYWNKDIRNSVFKNVKETTEWLLKDSKILTTEFDAINIDKMQINKSKSDLENKQIGRLIKFIQNISNNVLYKSKTSTDSVYVMNYNNPYTWVIIFPGLDIYKDQGETRFMTIILKEINKPLNSIFNHDLIETIYQTGKYEICFSKIMSLNRNRWEHMLSTNPIPFIDLMKERCNKSYNDIADLIYIYMNCSYGNSVRTSGLIDHFRYMLPNAMAWKSGLLNYISDKFVIPLKTVSQCFLMYRLRKTLSKYIDNLPQSERLELHDDKLNLETTGLKFTLQSAFADKVIWNTREEAFGELFVAFHLTGKDFYDDFNRHLGFMDTIAGGEMKFREKMKEMKFDTNRSTILNVLKGFKVKDYKEKDILNYKSGPFYMKEAIQCSANYVAEIINKKLPDIEKNIMSEKIFDNVLSIKTMTSTRSSILDNYTSITALELTLKRLHEYKKSEVNKIEFFINKWEIKITENLMKIIEEYKEQYKELKYKSDNWETLNDQIINYNKLYLDYEMELEENKESLRMLLDELKAESTSKEVKLNESDDDDDYDYLDDDDDMYLKDDEEFDSDIEDDESMYIEEKIKINKQPVSKTYITLSEKIEKINEKKSRLMELKKKALENLKNEKIFDFLTIENISKIILGTLQSNMNDEIVTEIYENVLNKLREEFYKDVKLLNDSFKHENKFVDEGNLNNLSVLSLSFDVLNKDHIYKVVHKGQRTAVDREIFIQNDTRFSSYVLEHLMRSIAKCLDIEAITYSGDNKALKLKEMARYALSWQNQGVKQGKERKLLYITGDMTKWSNWDSEMRLHRFCKSLGLNVKHDFISDLLTTYSGLGVIKKTKFKDVFHRKENVQKFNKVDEIFKNLDSIYPIAELYQNWLQGMRNYTSSVAHCGVSLLMKKIFEKISKTELYFDTLVHSDDWVCVIGWTQKINGNKYVFEHLNNDKPIENQLINIIMMTYKINNLNVSIKKSSISEYMSEFVSYVNIKQSLYLGGEKQLVSILSDLPNSGTSEDSFSLISKAQNAISKGMCSYTVDKVLMKSFDLTRMKYSMSENQKYDPVKIFNVKRSLLPTCFFPDINITSIHFFLSGVEAHDYAVYNYLKNKYLDHVDKNKEMSVEEINSFKFLLANSIVFFNSMDYNDISSIRKLHIFKGFNFIIQQDLKDINLNCNDCIKKRFFDCHRLIDPTFDILQPTDDYSYYLASHSKTQDEMIRYSMINKNKTVQMRMRSQIFHQKCIKLEGYPEKINMNMYYELIKKNMNRINESNIKNIIDLIEKHIENMATNEFNIYNWSQKLINMGNDLRKGHQKTIMTCNINIGSKLFLNNTMDVINYTLNPFKLYNKEINPSIELDKKKLTGLFGEVDLRNCRQIKKYSSDLQSFLMLDSGHRSILTGPKIKTDFNLNKQLLMIINNSLSEKLIYSYMEDKTNIYHYIGLTNTFKNQNFIENINTLFLIHKVNAIYPNVELIYKNKKFNENYDILKVEYDTGVDKNNIPYYVKKIMAYFHLYIYKNVYYYKNLSFKLLPIYTKNQEYRSVINENCEGFINMSKTMDSIILFEFKDSRVKFSLLEEDAPKIELLINHLDEIFRYKFNLHKRNLTFEELLTKSIKQAIIWQNNKYTYISDNRLLNSETVIIAIVIFNNQDWRLESKINLLKEPKVYADSETQTIRNHKDNVLISINNKLNSINYNEITCKYKENSIKTILFENLIEDQLLHHIINNESGITVNYLPSRYLRYISEPIDSQLISHFFAILNAVKTYSESFKNVVNTIEKINVSKLPLYRDFYKIVLGLEDDQSVVLSDDSDEIEIEINIDDDSDLDIMADEDSDTDDDDSLDRFSNSSSEKMTTTSSIKRSSINTENVVLPVKFDTNKGYSTEKLKRLTYNYISDWLINSYLTPLSKKYNMLDIAVIINQMNSIKNFNKLKDNSNNNYKFSLLLFLKQIINEEVKKNLIKRRKTDDTYDVKEILIEEYVKDKYKTLYQQAKEKTILEGINRYNRLKDLIDYSFENIEEEISIDVE